MYPVIRPDKHRTISIDFVIQPDSWVLVSVDRDFETTINTTPCCIGVQANTASNQIFTCGNTFYTAPFSLRHTLTCSVGEYFNHWRRRLDKSITIHCRIIRTVNCLPGLRSPIGVKNESHTMITSANRNSCKCLLPVGISASAIIPVRHTNHHCIRVRPASRSCIYLINSGGIFFIINIINFWINSFTQTEIPDL
ncbi:hypothetical protein CIFRMM109B1_18955 [Citrobacter freundii]